MSAAYEPVHHQGSGYYPDEDTSQQTHMTDNVPLRALPALGPTKDGGFAQASSIKEDPTSAIHTQTNSRWSRFWVWELLAAAFSLICIAVIVIVLVYENGKRLDRWALSISPNAVISFISTLAKSSCVLVLAEVIGQLRWIHFASAPRSLSDLQTFDDASRGPWGAVKLIFQTRHKALLASCAAVLVIASLVTDPFVQLVLTFPSRLTPAPVQVASIGVAHAYDANTTVTANHGVPYPVPQNAPFNLQSAVISAAFGTDPRFELDCPTANCTFPPVTTLGICSTCEDVTDASKTVCGTVSGQTTCNTTTPHRLLNSTMFSWRMAIDAAGQYADVWNSSSVPVTPDIAAMYLDYGQPAILAAFTALKLDRGLDYASSRPTKPSLVIQCTFSYCLKTYDNIEVRSGTTNIGRVDEAIMTFSSYQWYSSNPYSSEGSAIFTMQAQADGRMVGPNYTMNYWDHLNLGQYMYDVMNSTVELNTGTYAPGQGGSMAPSFGLAMYNAENLTAMVDKIAESMTNSMRNSQFNATTLNGTALVLETYIHIEWKWLALPIAISILSLALLIIVMMKSHARGLETWKSSSMPLLFYDLKEWEQSPGQFKTPGHIKRMSDNMKGLLSLDSQSRVFARGV